MATNDIIFFININNKESFARCSNFISKVIKHEQLDAEETKDILYKRGELADGEIGSLEWHRCLEKKYADFLSGRGRLDTGFKKIQEPQGISNIGEERFRVVYYLRLEEEKLYEIVQYRELILLICGYKNADIHAHIIGCNEFYFKLSQYLSWIVQEFSLRDCIYFENKDKKEFKRLQKENIQQSTSFLPLIVVNQHNAQRLKDKCINQLGESVFRKIIDHKCSYKDIQKEIVWEELGGIVMQFLNGKNIFAQIEPEQWEKVIKQLDVLALALMAYSMKGYKKNITIAELNSYARQQQQYANACHQLMENILFHSVPKWGLLSVRVHSLEEGNSNRYLKECYGKNEIKEDYFEVHICDFAAEKDNQNIAEHFLGQLDVTWKDKFKGMNPNNLFRSALAVEDEYIELWREYYGNPEYFGKHFGLRIFQNITKANNGFFSAESHAGHKMKEGDSYYYDASGTQLNYVMPGTTYGILLPLKKGREQAEKNTTQEYGSWLCINPERLLEMTTCNYEPKFVKDDYHDQENKNELISQRANDLRIFIDSQKKKTDVISVDAACVDDNEAEVWGKAILIAQCCLERRPHIVLYGCTEMFMAGFRDTIRGMFNKVLEEVFGNETFQIALITKKGEQVSFLPGDVQMTDDLNQYISRMRGIRCDTIFGTGERQYRVDRVAGVFIPFDIIVQVNGTTLFEKYVHEMLNQDIQSEQHGCKISPTHMRLGSTIHIDQFYEAELIFGNAYFISRFAFLVLKDILHDLLKRENARITLYGYASYSETLLVTLRKAMLAWSEERNIKLDVDYILLEREEEQRERVHIDRIRYVRDVKSEEYQVADVKGRKYVVIVPINSTMKTHQRLIGLLKEENPRITDDNILRNYALILVGPEKSNYWKKTKDNLLQCTYFIKPDPQYFIHVQTEYQESLTCNMCFPVDPVWERPLIEVNAASTIPNQAFGTITKEKKLDKRKLNNISSYIIAEENKLKVLKDCLVYGHTTRNDTHFLYYVKTEELVVCAEKGILESLEKWKSNITIKDSEYHIIVAPMHYSNCQFVEMVNEQIFAGMASVIRIDFNKDFRNNAYAKYSNIRQYLRQLAEMGKEIEVKFHFVDDNIITGRTFFRAKSLIESITGVYHEDFYNVKTTVFDRVFTLIDRNSLETKMQYLSCARTLEDVEKYFFCFLQIRVSSLRNYGDSCVICNLYKEAHRLHGQASTGVVAKYWGDAAENFQVCTVEKFVEKKLQKLGADELKEKKLRAYRRLFCTHMIKVAFEKLESNNQTENVSRIVLSLLVEDYKYRSAEKEEAFEYFVSYLKVCSRPFLVFQKPIKEAVYDILLIIIECIVKKQRVAVVLKRRDDEKAYWWNLKAKWVELETEILNNLNAEQRWDLVLLIMKQLTELKSNYIIRLNNINAFFEFMEPYKEVYYKKERCAREEFWRIYATLIKKLTGVSSDTSKSMWLDYALLHRKEMNGEQQVNASEKIDPLFSQIICLENTTNFQDGFEKIYKHLKTKDVVWDNINQYTKTFYSEQRVNYVIYRYLLYWETQDSAKEAKQSKVKMREELIKHTSDKDAACPGNIKEASKIESSSEALWKGVLNYLKLHIGKEDEKICNNLKESYCEATEGYQFLNFRRLMCEMHWGQEVANENSIQEDFIFSEEGVRQITCCLAIKKLCEEADYTEEALLERIGKIAKLAGAMLGDKPVQIWAEYQDSAEYYKKVIVQKIEEKGLQLRMKEENLPQLKIRRHYHIIGGNTGFVIALDEEAQELLNSDKVLERLKEYGYYYEGENFLWQMGRRSRYPLYFFTKVQKEETDFLYKIRNLLYLSNDIEKSLFSEGKENYLHEIDLANSRLSVLNREKSYSHTKAENRIRNYKRLAEGGNQSQHDSLVLLSDLNVSRIYRDSLNREFYQMTDSFGGMRLKMEFFRQGIREQMHGEYSENGPVDIFICNDLKIEGDKAVEEDEELIFPAEREQEVMSLLLALILNVKERGRGIKLDKGKAIHVYFSKTEEGMFRILSKTNCDEAELDKIRNCLWREPANEESGITLWSLGACIRRAVVCYVRRELSKITDIEGMGNVKNLLRCLTENVFEIKLNIKNVDEDSYFSYELPIFRELYERKNGNCKSQGGVDHE